MDRIFNWMIDHPKAARLWIILAMLAIVVLLIPAPLLLIPGFWENVKYLEAEHRFHFYVFVVPMGVITSSCVLIWSLGNAWEKLGEALQIDGAAPPPEIPGEVKE